MLILGTKSTTQTSNKDLFLLGNYFLDLTQRNQQTIGTIFVIFSSANVWNSKVKGFILKSMIRVDLLNLWNCISNFFNLLFIVGHEHWRSHNLIHTFQTDISNQHFGPQINRTTTLHTIQDMDSPHTHSGHTFWT